MFQPLITELEIRRRTAQLAQQVAADYREREFVVVIVLKGAFVFASDLVRRMFDQGGTPEIDFIQAASYGKGDRSSGKVEIKHDVTIPLKGRDVIIVDDIVDSGRTMVQLRKHLAAKGAASVRCCVLLDKPSRREVEFTPDYIGFEVPDQFVVGYGMDYGERYRNLPFISTISASDASRP